MYSLNCFYKHFLECHRGNIFLPLNVFYETYKNIIVCSVLVIMTLQGKER